MTHPLDKALAACIEGKPDESEAILRTMPEDPRALFNLGWHDMRHGKLNKGFEGMNYGRVLNVFGNERIPGPIWKDQPLKNKTLMLKCEGGFGDEIINFRFAYDFKAKGANVVVCCHEALAQIFSRHGFVCVSEKALPFILYDYWVPAMSAAYVLGYEFDTLSGKQYLNAEPATLAKKPGTLKVGVRWSGNPQFEHEQHRKFDSQTLIDMHKLHGVTFYGFQRDQDVVENLPFQDLGPDLKSWEDTASHLAAMDLVITSCTSVAHMAAALGKETWIVVPIMPYYLWAVPGDTSAWYDSVRLFRQTKYGDWTEPMNQIKQALQKRVTMKAAA
jgi:hypothetical protein